MHTSDPNFEDAILNPPQPSDGLQAAAERHLARAPIEGQLPLPAYSPKAPTALVCALCGHAGGTLKRILITETDGGVTPAYRHVQNCFKVSLGVATSEFKRLARGRVRETTKNHARVTTDAGTFYVPTAKSVQKAKAARKAAKRARKRNSR